MLIIFQDAIWFKIQPAFYILKITSSYAIGKRLNHRVGDATGMLKKYGNAIEDVVGVSVKIGKVEMTSAFKNIPKESARYPRYD